jgi:hypothetical protein
MAAPLVLVVLVVLEVSVVSEVRRTGSVGRDPVPGQQKTSWPEAQEAAGERDVAFAVR